MVELRKEYDYDKEKKKLTLFFLLMILFAIATVLGGIMVIRMGYNSLYSVIPALITLTFSSLCKQVRKRIQRRELRKDRD